MGTEVGMEVDRWGWGKGEFGKEEVGRSSRSGNEGTDEKFLQGGEV